MFARALSATVAMLVLIARMAWRADGAAKAIRASAGTATSVDFGKLRSLHPIPINRETPPPLCRGDAHVRPSGNQEETTNSNEIASESEALKL